MRLIWSLVEQSLSEADFLWTTLDDALDTAIHSFADVEARIEPRLHGMLDGVMVAGTSAIRPLLSASIRDRELGLAGVSAYLLSKLSDPAADRVLEYALRDVSGTHSVAYQRGLGRAAQVEALHGLWEKLADAPGASRAVVLEALSFCGRAPDGNWKALLDDDSPQLRAAAASALRFAPPPAIERYVHFACDTSDPEARNRALAAGIAAGSCSAWRRCLSHLRAPDHEAGPLLVFAAALGGEREVAHIIDLCAQPVLCRDAIWALGFSGTVGAVDACLARMRTGKHVRVAAEAVCAITGLDLSAQQLRAAEPDTEPVPSLEDDDLERSLVLGGDDLLPVPDVPGVEAWWERHRAAYAGNRRYLAGRARTLDALCSALHHGPTRRRAALAHELAARSAGACAVQPLALCRDQRRELERLAALHPNVVRNASSVLGIAGLAES